MQVDLNVTGERRIKEQYRKLIADDPLLKGLLTSEPAAIESWVDANITTIASGRALFKKILLILRYLIRQSIVE